MKDDIMKKASEKGIDPYTQPFKPSELGLRASEYGSFSDYCSEKETVSGKWNAQVILEAVEFDNADRPYRYLLLREKYRNKVETKSPPKSESLNLEESNTGLMENMGSHKIEKFAEKLLIERLKQLGHNVRKSDKKTFDFIVDGKYAEMKAKNHKYDKLDFISLTDAQYLAIATQKDGFDIYLVCNIQERNPEPVEIYKFNVKALINKKARQVVSYEYDKSIIDLMPKEKL
ncbi:MAG: hypothetical protein NT148_02290 [Candidatus Nealsonbacteria bacterium]|nr:hypothetical protein [Candidatus Nealsonbacteria bacterium]